MADFIVNENSEETQAGTSKAPMTETTQDSNDMGQKDDIVPFSVIIDNEEEKEMFSRSHHQ